MTFDKHHSTGEHGTKKILHSHFETKNKKLMFSLTTDHPWARIMLLALTLLCSELGVGTYLAHSQGMGGPNGGLGTITTPEGATIFAEIADSPNIRSKGLMFRKSIAPDWGMLFLFPELGDHTFWMKNTLISLDIFWLDKSGTILHLEKNVPICTRKDDGCPRYRAPLKSLQVLELNAGMAKKLGLKIGSQLTIDLPPMSFPY